MAEEEVLYETDVIRMRMRITRAYICTGWSCIWRWFAIGKRKKKKKKKRIIWFCFVLYCFYFSILTDSGKRERTRTQNRRVSNCFYRLTVSAFSSCLRYKTKRAIKPSCKTILIYFVFSIVLKCNNLFCYTCVFYYILLLFFFFLCYFIIFLVYTYTLGKSHVYFVKLTETRLRCYTWDTNNGDAVSLNNEM
mgnify:CR=1 FL=1